MIMGKENEHMEIYSGYDPAWKLAHNPNLWIKGLMDEGIIPTVDELLLENSDLYCGFVPAGLHDQRFLFGRSGCLAG